MATPQVAFLGDTTVDVFSREAGAAAAILACNVVVVECTLLGQYM